MAEEVKGTHSTKTGAASWETMNDKIGDIDLAPLYTALGVHEANLYTDLDEAKGVDLVLEQGLDSLIATTDVIASKVANKEEITVEDFEETGLFDWYANYGGGYDYGEESGELGEWQSSHIKDGDGNVIEDPTAEDVKNFFDQDGDGILSRDEADAIMNSVQKRLDASASWSAREMTELQYRMSNYVTILSSLTELMRNILNEYKRGYGNV